jgi:hypothetical protein
MKDHVIKDSSLWESAKYTEISRVGDTYIKIGVVREAVVVQDPDKKDVKTVKYMVDVWSTGQYIVMSCIMAISSGGIFNYEEYTLQGFNKTNNKSNEGGNVVKPGDNVVVASLNGNSREGVILGFVRHPAKAVTFKDIDINKTQRYIKEFNGLEEYIDDKGQYIQTFKGSPTNVSDLNKEVTGSKLPDPKYDYSKGGSFYKWMQDGSFLLTDNANTTAHEDIISRSSNSTQATDGISQSLYVNKSGKKIVITSGTVKVTLDKTSKQFNVDCEDSTITAKTSITVDAGNCKMTMKGGKVAIHGASDEVLSLISEALQELSTTTAAGFGAPLSSVAKFAAIKKRLDAIKGS